MVGSVVAHDMGGYGDLDTVSMMQACQMLGVSRRTLYYWIKSGRVETRRTALGSQRVLMASVQSAVGTRRGH